MTLLAGILGVSNIMMISVRERTREIGIRRAIGATPWAILAQILKESTVLTTFAGALGLMSGVGLLELVGTFLNQGPAGEPSLLDPPHAQFSVAALASVVMVAGGAGAGLIPALQALRVRPVVALRDE
jgi:putative ABC transport system permease protein